MGAGSTQVLERRRTTPTTPEFTMKAFRLLSWKTEGSLVDVEVPRAGPGDVVIRVGGAGACHSDLHLMHEFEEGLVPWGPPFTLGHENAGWVHEIGEGVEGFEPGQAVAVYGPWGCGRCTRCLAGVETYCLDVMNAPVPGGGGGLGLDGGMAEYMLVRDAQRHLLVLPEGLEPAAAAPLTDAGLTPYHAIRRSRHLLTPGSHCVVIGVGGLGGMAVQLLKATTATTIIAVDTNADALAVAKDYGADIVIESGDDAAEVIREVMGGRGAEVVIDNVGADATLALGAGVVDVLGQLTIVGIGGGTLPVSFFSLPYEASVQTTYWGSRGELAEVLNLAARGLITPTVTTYPLAEAARAYQELAAGDVRGRAVIVP
jgi:alcohol dehydrogenase, propanol-preferring